MLVCPYCSSSNLSIDQIACLSCRAVRIQPGDNAPVTEIERVSGWYRPLERIDDDDTPTTEQALRMYIPPGTILEED